MKKVLIVLTSAAMPEKAIDYAVSSANEKGAGVVALFLLETELSGEIFDKFTDIGFIGDKPSAELSESLMREYRQRGYEQLGRVQIKAMEEGVDFEPLMEEGSFVQKALDVMSRYDAAEAVLFKRRERRFLDYFSRSMADEVKKRAHCPVKVFTEGDDG